MLLTRNAVLSHDNADLTRAIFYNVGYGTGNTPTGVPRTVRRAALTVERRAHAASAVRAFSGRSAGNVVATDPFSRAVRHFC